MKISFKYINHIRPNYNFKTNPTVSVLKQQSCDTISFGIRQSPVYAINLYGEFEKLDTYKDAAQRHGCTPNKISAHLSGRDFCAINGVAYANPQTVEILNENGQIKVDIKKINKAREKILEAQRGAPLITLDERGVISIFENPATAKKFLNIRFLNPNEKYVLGGYASARLCDVVAKNRNGEILYLPNNDFKMDLNKISELYIQSFKKEPVEEFVIKKYCSKDTENGIIIEEIKQKKKNKLRNGLYALNLDGSYKKYSEPKEICDILQIPQNNIYNYIYNHSPIKGTILARAKDIETTNKDGNVVVDEEKIKELKKNFIKANLGYSIVGFDKDTSIYLFNDIKDAQAKTGITQNKIWSSIAEIQPEQGYIFARLADVVKRDPETDEPMFKRNGSFMYDYEVADYYVSILNSEEFQ